MIINRKNELVSNAFFAFMNSSISQIDHEDWQIPVSRVFINKF